MRQSINRAAKLVSANAADSPVAKRSKVGEELVTEKATASKPKAKRQPKKAKVVDSGTKEKAVTTLLGAKDPLVSLGKLFQGRILRRPSEHIKSPYVADVKLDPEFGGAEVIAHAPMLDLGGLIKPGSIVRMTESKPGGKTSHAVQLVRVEEVECGEGGTTWVGANPMLGNKVARQLLERGLISEAGLGAEADSRPTDIKSEVKMPKETEEEETVRADFVVDDVVVEVKSCVCADYQKDLAPPSNKKDRYVIVSSDADSKEYIRTGIFPIGKQGQDFEGSKVVSARCIKHLRHLAHLASSGKPSCLLLVVNRGDCKQFRPCFEACPMFAREFDKAVAAGVRIVAAGVTWNEHGDSYFTKLLPILSNDQKEF